MPTIVSMPQLGESVVEGTVVRWIAKTGQRVERDEPLVEVATDKANTEIPAPSSGVLAEIVAQEGTVVPVGGPLCRLEEAGAGQGAAAPKAAAAAQQSAIASSAAHGAEGSREAGNGLRASPVVHNIAQEHGLDLGKVAGSGSGGRITKADVMGYLSGQPGPGPTQSLVNPAGSSDSSAPVLPAGVAGREAAAGSSGPSTAAPAPQRTIPPPVQGALYGGPIALSLRAYKPPRYTPKDGDQVMPFDQRRRLIAEHMVYSKATSPHVPCTAEVDMSALTKRRQEWKADKATSGRAPSFLVGICRAVVQALAEFPRFNAVVQDESLIVRRDINLGVAVETEKGLLVPVIRRANELSVLGLNRALDDLAGRARSGKVTADELSGGSFTVSNPGLKGNLFGAAIINQPQVGILRMGEIVKRAVVREHKGEDAIVIRPMMYLTLSYDHRVIDGVTGNGFLHRVRELIEAADFTL